MAAAKDHLVSLTYCMNLWWLSHRWFNFMQFVDVFVPLVLPFGFDVGGYSWFQIRDGGSDISHLHSS